jgi:hypothetical protein
MCPILRSFETWPIHRAASLDGVQRADPQTQFNQVVVSQEQLQQMRALRASMTEEEKHEMTKRQATPEGLEELQKIGT